LLGDITHTEVDGRPDILCDRLNQRHIDLVRLALVRLECAQLPQVAVSIGDNLSDLCLRVQCSVVRNVIRGQAPFFGCLFVEHASVLKERDDLVVVCLPSAVPLLNGVVSIGVRELLYIPQRLLIVRIRDRGDLPVIVQPLASHSDCVSLSELRKVSVFLCP